MSSILDFKKKYYKKIDALDLDLLIASTINKPREFVLTHPEYKIPRVKIENLKLKITRRKRGEPLAYILGKKEFYGLEFKVTKNTLIPRPETELIVENVLKLQPKNKIIIDVGTGSGNIIISLVKKLEKKNIFIATDISSKALIIARQNSKKHKVDKKIKFLHGNLLEPIIQNSKFKIQNCLIVANLPYLSSKIYSQTSPSIKNYEPKSALLSNDNGLNHYKKLLSQLEEIKNSNPAIKITFFLEFSPEQKVKLKKTVSSVFSKCYSTFFKDLSGRFRFTRVEL